MSILLLSVKTDRKKRPESTASIQFGFFNKNTGNNLIMSNGSNAQLIYEKIILFFYQNYLNL